MNSDEDQNTPTDGQISPPNGSKKKSKSTFGQGGFGDKSCNIWKWPLSKVTVRNTETTFQASLGFTPFKKNEISVSKNFKRLNFKVSQFGVKINYSIANRLIDCIKLFKELQLWATWVNRQL